MERPEFAYIGRKPCGCVVAIIVDDPDPKRKKHTGREVGAWIADGLNVERVRCEDARLNGDCPHPALSEDEQFELFP